MRTHAASSLPKRASPARDELPDRRRIGEVGDSCHCLDRTAELLELGNQSVCGFSDHQVVAAASELAGEVGAEVRVGIGDQGDALGHIAGPGRVNTDKPGTADC